MKNVVVFISFKLKKGVSVPDFLQAAEKLNNEYISKLKGYISWQQLTEGDMWFDILTWETMEDAKAFEKPETTNDLAKQFYSFINLFSCKVKFLIVERNYK